jgi:hypothetical protein
MLHLHDQCSDTIGCMVVSSCKKVLMSVSAKSVGFNLHKSEIFNLANEVTLVAIIKLFNRLI